jgi:hypothetical protein
VPAPDQDERRPGFFSNRLPVLQAGAALGGKVAALRAQPGNWLVADDEDDVF